MDGDSHGGASPALVHSVSQAHDDLRHAARPAMSPAGVAQMEAAAPVSDVRQAVMPPVQNELLLPLLPNAPTAPQHTAGHQHSYGVHQQVQMPPGDVPYTMMFPAGADDRSGLMAGRVPTAGMMADSGPRRDPVDQESFHLMRRRPERQTVYHDPYHESQMLSDLTAFSTVESDRQRYEQLKSELQTARANSRNLKGKREEAGQIRQLSFRFLLCHGTQLESHWH